MGNVIDFDERLERKRQRARLGRRGVQPINRRARATSREGGEPSFVHIGEVSFELMRRLRGG